MLPDLLSDFGQSANPRPRCPACATASSAVIRSPQIS